MLIFQLICNKKCYMFFTVFQTFSTACSCWEKFEQLHVCLPVICEFAALSHTHTHFSLNNLLVCIYTDEHDDGRTDAWHAEPRDDASPAAASWYDDAAAGLHDAERVRSPATSTATTTFKSGYSK